MAARPHLQRPPASTHHRFRYARILLVVGVLFAFGLLAPDATTAAVSEQCRACHQERFATGAVDRLSACAPCHSVDASHTYHNAGSDCGKCHKDGAGKSYGFRVPYEATPYGRFNTSASAAADGSRIHAIHLNATWIATWRAGRCAGCHAAVPCTACHSDVDHGAHGATSTCTSSGCHQPSAVSAPVIKDPGIYFSSPTLNAAWGPYVMTGYWRTMAQSALYVGQVLHDTPSAGASMQLTLTGSRVRVFGPTRLGYSGIADVYLDGVRVASITAYSVSEKFNQVLWDSGPIEQGVHTLRIVHSGARLAGTTSNYFAVDCMEVFSTAEDLVQPCTGCHEGDHSSLHESVLGVSCSACHSANLVTEHVSNRAMTCEGCHESSDARVSDAIVGGRRDCAACHDTATHPAPASSHRANVEAVTLTGTIVNPSGIPFRYWDGSVQTFGGQPCGRCHLMDLEAEHSKPSSSVSALSCAACHATPRNSFGVWDRTCQQGGCHPTIHGQMALKHRWTWTEQEASCGAASASCHPGEWASDVAAVHNEAWRNGTVFAATEGLISGCPMCHVSNSVVPPTTSSCRWCHPYRHSAALVP